MDITNVTGSLKRVGRKLDVFGRILEILDQKVTGVKVITVAGPKQSNCAHFKDYGYYE